MMILKNLSEIVLSDIYRIARKISKNDKDMVKIFAIRKFLLLFGFLTSYCPFPVFPLFLWKRGPTKNV